jgi:hypothetical protein
LKKEKKLTMENNKELQGRKVSVSSENRTATFTASTYDKDRHRSVVNQSKWQLENFNSNGIIGYQHNVYGASMCEKATPDDVIGKGRAYMEGDELLIEVEFKPEGRSAIADKVFEDVRDGFLKAVSVGFAEIGKGVLKNDASGEESRFDGYIPEGHTYYFESQELLEVSVVNIPSNPKALKKAYRESTFDALNYLLKAFDYKYNRGEIFKMSVKEIISLLDNNEENSAMIEADKTERDQVIRSFEIKY